MIINDKNEESTDIFITFTLQIVSHIVEVGISSKVAIRVNTEVSISISLISNQKNL